MDPIKCLETIKAALNAATEKGVIGDLKTAFVLYQCLETIEKHINDQHGGGTIINDASN